MRKNFKGGQAAGAGSSERRSKWPWLLVAGCVLVILLGLLHSLRHESAPSGELAAEGVQGRPEVSTDFSGTVRLGQSSRSTPAIRPEEIVAAKVSQFART